MNDVGLITVWARSSSRFLRVLVLALCAWLLTFHPEPAKGSSLSASVLPANFQESVVFNNGLSLPTAVRFAPDGRVFVAQKNGMIKVFASLTATSPTTFADLRTKVDDYDINRGG